MLKNENIICISSIDWDFIWQGHQEIMSAFARNGNRVLFIENTGVRKPTFKDMSRLKKRITMWFKSVKGFRRESDNIFVYSPLMVPLQYSKIARWINRRLLLEPLKRWTKAMSFNNPVVWTFLPTGTALDIIDEIYDRKLLVYYNIADFDALTDNPAALRKSEDTLIKKCDIIFAQGKAIADKCAKLNPNVHIFPFGVNSEVFESFLKKPDEAELEDLKGVKRPIIGYVGGLHKHLDITLISYMAEKHPEWSIVLVGPRQIDTAEIDHAPNIFLLGKKEFGKLPAYIDKFDVCTIPYIISEYTKTVYPTKLNEYQIMGKPVVSTALPEVEALNAENNNITAIARDHKEFVELVERSLAPDAGKAAADRIKAAGKHRWSDRIERMSVIMEQVIRRKNEEPVNWQDKFLHFYKNTKRGMIKALLLAAAVYFVVFYTPVFWWAAQPLVVSDRIVKADSIAVLGGGVGESGKAGEGYEERAEYAIQLYNEGYSGRIIFSSGYTYVFKETLVMKALAVSQGVPESAVILENKAVNTYEKVKYIKEILDKNGWKSVIVLSSPYHMMRVSKVFNKQAPGIKVIYAPISNSSFYSHAKEGIFTRKIDLRQIGGIVHEYLGIAYYWWKGWI